MSKKIIGVTVGTPLNPSEIKKKMNLESYATEDYVKGYAQPKGKYLTEHQDISGKLDANKLPEAINAALTQAKNSGEFDGKDGKDGKDGYTPQKGIDYFDGKDGKDGIDGQDGYTPQKGVDYFDGQPGKDGVDGKDGYTPVKGVDYFDGSPGRDGVDGKDGSDGYTPVKGKDYFDGKDGKDGSPGVDGSDGITPHIGSNGNWFIGNNDTGKPSRGADGQQGPAGPSFAVQPTAPTDTSVIWVDTSEGTDNEMQEIVNAVIASLPVYNGEVV